MTTWRYQLFVISVGAQAGAVVLGHQGLQDQLNDLGRERWELTAVTSAKAFKPERTLTYVKNARANSACVATPAAWQCSPQSFAPVEPV